MAEHELTVSFYLPGMAERSLTRLPTFTLRVADSMNIRALIVRAATNFVTPLDEKKPYKILLPRQISYSVDRK